MTDGNDEQKKRHVVYDLVPDTLRYSKEDGESGPHLPDHRYYNSKSDTVTLSLSKRLQTRRMVPPSDNNNDMK